MKRIIFSSFLAAILLSACEKNDLNEPKYWDYSDQSQALLKFVNSFTALTPSLGTPTANGPTVDFYVNNVKFNAAAMGYATYYPNTTGGGAFAGAPNGPVNIKAVLNRPT